MDQHQSKRQRLAAPEKSDAFTVRQQRAAFLSSLSQPVSPPRRVATAISAPTTSVATNKSPRTVTIAEGLHPKSSHFDESRIQSGTRPSPTSHAPEDRRKHETVLENIHVVPDISSPIQLTAIRDLEPKYNVESITLNDILGNPLIKDAWIFNFCFDVEWLMTHFDPDVRDIVNVKIIHGSWRREDGNKIRIDEACNRWSNVEALQAYLPDAFGTHHSKMFVLFTHDDTAEVIIHTANMLQQDWTNMTQAVWRSGSLSKSTSGNDSFIGEIGSGSRFRYDLLAYLKSYGSKVKNLVSALQQFDFTPIRGALIASIPSKLGQNAQDDSTDSQWGHLALGRALHKVRRDQQSARPPDKNSSDHVVCQVSSIATLSNPWLEMFKKTLFSSSTDRQNSSPHQHQLSIVYPTAPNVSRSLDGYAAGGSIHTKAQSTAHLKQIESLRGHLCQWTEGPIPESRVGRHLAAPHIKTFICFKGKPTMEIPGPEIKWALLTSANLSTQAWGSVPKDKAPKSNPDPERISTTKHKSAPKKKVQHAGHASDTDTEVDDNQNETSRIVHIQSYEIGVLIWPELFRDTASGMNKVRILPQFNTTDGQTKYSAVKSGSNATSLPPNNVATENDVIVSFRIPYDLPLTPYAKDDLPWSPQSTYDIPDRFGRRWPRDFF